MLIHNIELHWTKVDPENPDMGFDKNTPQMVTDLRTRNKDIKNEWVSKGATVKTADDDDGIYYNWKVKKPCFLKNGAKNKPVPVVGPDLMPIEDITTIGNGTIANVSVHTFDYNFQGKKGVGFRLEAIQIVKLVEYKGASGGNYGFTSLTSDAVAPVADDAEAY